MIRLLLHLPVGLFNAGALFLGWKYGLLFGVGFLAYEIVQHWAIKDKAHKDIVGWLVGLAVGIAVIGWLQYIAF